MHEQDFGIEPWSLDARAAQSLDGSADRRAG